MTGAFFCQIAIAIGALHLIGGGGRRTTLVDGRGTRVPLYVVPLLCHRRVPLQCAMLRGEGEGQLWRSGCGAIAGWNCSMLWLWGEGEGHLSGVVPLLGAILVCHDGVRAIFGGVDVVPFVLCNVEVTTNLGEDVVPLQGAIVVCYGLGGGDEPLWRIGRGAGLQWTWCQEGDQLRGSGSLRSGRGAIAGLRAPLRSAIVVFAGCHCSVLWLGGGDDQLWGSGRGAIAGCHCWVPL